MRCLYAVLCAFLCVITSPEPAYAQWSYPWDKVRFLNAVEKDDFGEKTKHFLTQHELVQVLRKDYGVTEQLVWKRISQAEWGSVECHKWDGHETITPLRLVETFQALAAYRRALDVTAKLPGYESQGRQDADRAMHTHLIDLGLVTSGCTPETAEGVKRMLEDFLAAYQKRIPQLLTQSLADLQRDRTREAAKQDAQERRQKDLADLKAGRRPIVTVNDAAIYYDAPNGYRLAESPLVTPNGKVYLMAGVLRPSPSSADVMVFQLTGREILYFLGRRGAQTKLEPGYSARFNEMVAIVGRYVANETYTTVGGQTRIAPVFDVIVIGPDR